MKNWYWEISIDTTKVALERLARALLTTNSGLPAGKRLMPHYKWGRGISAHLMVEVPDGRQDEFRDTAKPISMEAPVQATVGFDTPVDDGHPGRGNR